MTIGENGIGSFIHHCLLSCELTFFFDEKSNLTSTQVNCISKLIKNNADHLKARYSDLTTIHREETDFSIVEKKKTRLVIF